MRSGVPRRELWRARGEGVRDLSSSLERLSLLVRLFCGLESRPKSPAGSDALAALLPSNGDEFDEAWESALPGLSLLDGSDRLPSLAVSFGLRPPPDAFLPALIA